MALRIVFSVGATASVVVDTAVTVGVHAAALAAAVPAATLRVIMEEEVRTPPCAHREYCRRAMYAMRPPPAARSRPSLVPSLVFPPLRWSPRAA